MVLRPVEAIIISEKVIMYDNLNGDILYQGTIVLK